MGEKYTKNDGEHHLSLIGELYAGIPETPLEAWAHIKLNLRTGDLDSKVYVGVVEKF